MIERNGDLGIYSPSLSEVPKAPQKVECTEEEIFRSIASLTFEVAMYLQFYINEKGDKVYTTKKESPLGMATQSAHPARFSPDDKYSRQRVLLKKRFGLLPTQKPPPKY